MNINTLITECINSNNVAWKKFVKNYTGFVKNVIYYFITNRTDIDDILQNVFLRLLKNDFKLLKNFKGETEISFLAYLKSITLSTTKNYIKKHYKEIPYKELENNIIDNIFNPEDITIKKIKIENLKKSIMELPIEYRDVFSFLIKGYKHKEISQILKISINTVSTRIKRGKEKLKKIMKEKF